MNIYVGNIAYAVSESELEQAFGQYGEVSSVNIITDRYTGQSKGFGFVEMPNDEEANKAIEGMNGNPLKGRELRVNQARPRREG